METFYFEGNDRDTGLKMLLKSSTPVLTSFIYAYRSILFYVY